MLRAQDRTWHLILAACLRIGAADMSASCPITPDLRQEPGAGKPHAGICAGGREQSLSLPRPGPRSRASALRENPPKRWLQSLDFLGICPSETRLFNGLRVDLGAKKLSTRLFPAKTVASRRRRGGRRRTLASDRIAAWRETSAISVFPQQFAHDAILLTTEDLAPSALRERSAGVPPRAEFQTEARLTRSRNRSRLRLSPP